MSSTTNFYSRRRDDDDNNPPRNPTTTTNTTTDTTTNPSSSRTSGNIRNPSNYSRNTDTPNDNRDAYSRRGDRYRPSEPGSYNRNDNGYQQPREYRDRGRERVAESSTSYNRSDEQQPKDYRDRGRERAKEPSSYNRTDDSSSREYRDRGRERTVGDSSQSTSSSYRRSEDRIRDDRRGDDRRGGDDRRRDNRGRDERSRYAPSDDNHYTPRSYQSRKREQPSDPSSSYRPTKQPRHYDSRTAAAPSSSHYPSRSAEPELPPAEEIVQIEKELQVLSNIEPIEDLKVIDSRWGVKPKGFEQVSAQRAKLSGLFPLPGFPRPVDFTKLEGLIKDRLSNSSDILIESSKIDPVDSKVAKTLVIRNDLSKINYLKLVEFFNDCLKVIDIELNENGTSNIHSKKKTKDDKYLIIEFNDSECATIIYSLNGMELLFNAYKEENIPRSSENEKFKLVITRPNEYLVQNLPQQPLKESGMIEEIVKDSPRKITLVISPDTSVDSIREELEKIHPLHGMQYLRQKGTKDPLGIVFIEFEVIDKNHTLQQQINQLSTYIDKIKKISFVHNVFFSCIDSNNPLANIQDSIIDFHNLKALVRNEKVFPHPKSRVIQILNAVTVKELADDDNYQLILQDMKSEVGKYGTIKSIKIPRPDHDFMPDLLQFNQPSLGKIFVEFEDENNAFKAIMGISGMSYNDRTVLCCFFDYEDYQNGLY
ncbi:uncharacterized protein J8A68_003583 [[Candida] subhashii]|uniref:RRM domain-containing protein n=1 Tax=[Candida] subhashii TaxID=561895 RepID=A0A8J5UY86_9ASCO|nr:uncharacterized protein J8A68_003583 [[Candida] subhashii]KAG7662899.1 hypothetical protein J8A68_003583 [[Candida] subhashii]